MQPGQDQAAQAVEAAPSEAETEPLLVQESPKDLPPAYSAPSGYVAAVPMTVAPQPEKPEQWQTSLFGCCADMDAAKTTAKTVLCPCVAYGSSRDRILHQAVHGVPHPTAGDTCSSVCTAYGVVLALPHFGPIAAAMLRTIQRTQLRTVFGIAGNPFKDCLASTFCGPCSLVQTRRELDIRERDGQVQLVSEAESPILDSKASLPVYTEA